MFVMAECILAVAVMFIALVLAGIILLKNIRSSGKKSALAVIIPLFCVLAAGLVFSSFELFKATKVIGSYSGSEYDRITIDGVTYEADYDNDYSSSDKGGLLGRAVSATGSASADPMYVYSVRGTDEYIYALSAYEGTFFRKV